jgi:hypothetical protein
MQGVAPDQFEFLMTHEDRKRIDSRMLMTNLLLYSESWACKGFGDIWKQTEEQSLGRNQGKRLWGELEIASSSEREFVKLILDQQ